MATVSYLNDLSKKTGGAPTTIPDDASNEQLTEILNVCFEYFYKSWSKIAVWKFC